MNQSLFDPATDPPTLIGQHCTLCGRDAFPGNPYGCEACGAEAAEQAVRRFPARGRLRAFTTTLQASMASSESGFTVGVIDLEQGPAIRGMLDHEHRDLVRPGISVHAVATPRPDGQGHDLYFTPTNGPAV